MVDRRDAYTITKPADTEHVTKRAKAPAGSQASDFMIPGTGASVYTYWSSPAKAATLNSGDPTADSVLITIHGRDRNGDDYWKTFNNIYQSSKRSKQAPASMIVVAPQFYSFANDVGAYSGNEVTYADSNGWIAGDPSISPPGVSAFTILDAFVAHFADRSLYPNLKTITLVGHGGGGQLINRYSIIGADNPAPGRVSLRYVVGDPSTSLAFTQDRPEAVDRLGCPTFNNYRYGLMAYTPGLAYPLPFLGDAVSLFQRFLTRDVRFVIGGADNNAKNGDQSCMAQAWGGNARQQRSQAYYKYIWLMAGGDPAGVSKLYGNFPALPGGRADPSLPQSNPSDLTRFRSAQKMPHKIAFISGATHSAEQVYGSAAGRRFLFSDASQLSNVMP